MDSECQIFVLATTQNGTLAALRQAFTMAGAAGRVLLVGPRIVEYGTPLHGHCAGSVLEVLTGPSGALARRAGLEVAVRCAVAREPKHLPARLLLEHARIIVGGTPGG